MSSPDTRSPSPSHPPSSAPEPTDPAGADDLVVVEVAASPRSLRLLRMAAADAATEAGLDLDGVESARIAVDELASLLMSADGAGRLVVRYRHGTGRVVVEGTLVGASPEEPGIDSIVRELLTVCVDDWSLELVDGVPTFRFEKRANHAAAG